jgi:uncharacterized membrane protein
VISVQQSIEIARPVGEVFDYVADPEHLPEWQESALEVHKISDTRWKEERRFAGRLVETETEVIEREPGKRLRLRSDAGSVELEVDHVFSVVGNGTRLEVQAEGKVGGLMRFAEGTIERRARAEIAADLDRLKAILESAGR